MKYKQNILYKIRRIPAMLGLTALTAASCCEKPMVIEKEVDPIIKRDTTYLLQPDTTYIPCKPDTLIKHNIVFFVRPYVDEPTIETLQKYAAMDSVDNIFLSPAKTDDWDTYVEGSITYHRQNFFQPRIEVSPKIHGRGDFNFKLGEASKVPEDSLWFVQNGWTINKER